jgi:hypothetical protein
MRQRIVGWILIVLGVGLMLIAGEMDVTSPADPSIANTDLMEQRLLMFIGGAATFLAGVIGLGVERLRSALVQRRAADEAPPQ